MSGDIITEIDIVNTVKETINTLCNNLFESINSNVFPLLDEIIFIDSNISSNSYLERIFGDSINSGILLLANSLLAGTILYYAIRLLISHFSGENVESPYRFFIKTVLIGILMNYSLELCKLGINTTSTISDFFCSLGYEIFNKKISFITLTSELCNNFDQSFNIFSLDGILSTTLYISSFNLIISFSLRYILIKLLIILSPFCFLCLINIPTSFIFKSWLKCFSSLLILQIIVSIILLLPFAIMKEDSTSIFNKILLIGSITALLKSNQFVREFIGGLGITSDFQSNFANFSNLLIK